MLYIGWIGTALAISASVMIAVGMIKKDHWFFSSAMFLASVIFVISSFIMDNIQSVISNSFFIISSLLAMLGIILNFKFVSIKNMIIIALSFFIFSAIYYININKVDWFIQSIGWIPVITLPFSFMLFTQSKISEQTYFVSNIFTHITFFTHLMFVNNYPIAVLQVVCFMISLIGLSRNVFFNIKKA